MLCPPGLAGSGGHQQPVRGSKGAIPSRPLCETPKDPMQGCLTGRDGRRQRRNRRAHHARRRKPCTPYAHHARTHPHTRCPAAPFTNAKHRKQRTKRPAPTSVHGAGTPHGEVMYSGTRDRRGPQGPFHARGPTAGAVRTARRRQARPQLTPNALRSKAAVSISGAQASHASNGSAWCGKSSPK